MHAFPFLRSSSLLCLVLLLAGGSVACGGGGGGDTPDVARTYLGTQSPGDVWSWTLNRDTSFTASNSTLGHTYSGTWETLPSDFLKLTVTFTTEPGLTVPAEAYAIEVPDSALVIKPAGSDANVIVAVAATTCLSGPSVDFAWVELTRSTFDFATDTAYGTAALTITGSTWEGTTSGYMLDGTFDHSETAGPFTCAGGVLTDAIRPDWMVAMAPTGVFILDGGPGEGASMGMQLPPAPISLAAVTAPSREYRGFHYEDESLADADSVAIWARSDGAGGLIGHEYDDIESDVEAPPPHASIVFGTQATPGIVNATLTDSAGPADMVFLINRLGGRYFLFGIAADSHDGHPYNFVAIETGP